MAYDLHSLAVGLRHPKRGLIEMYSRLRDAVPDSPGIEIMDEDWDTLVVLDACRYDLFESENTIDGELQAVRSKGPHTGAFMRRNFDEGRFKDTVYVSANPRPASINASFYAVEYLWDTHWNDDLHTVHPVDVTDVALNAFERHPNKRLLVHYLQPHYPFIGRRGQTFHERHGYAGFDNQVDLWSSLREGSIDRDTAWGIYRENLQVALPHVQRLINGTDGRVVVTADHGNAFGEWSVWGHPNVHIEALLKIPWLVVERDERRTIHPGDADEEMSVDSDAVSQRLEQLGYID